MMFCWPLKTFIYKWNKVSRIYKQSEQIFKFNVRTEGKELIVNHTFARREFLENHVKSERSKLIIVIIRRELKGQCITIISSLLSATAGSPQATYQGRAKLKSLSPKFSDLRTSQIVLFTNCSVPQRNISPHSKLNEIVTFLI